MNIDLNDARKVLANSGTAVMGQAEATGENRAVEAVNEALDSPLLNDNDITGAEQVLLKIVSGVGDDEIKMSELSKIKNRIQQAAGRDVNIIEGIGFDDQLGSAVSVTVIATGFETKKVNEPVTIKLEENDIDIDEEINKSDDNQNNFNSQQTLLLEEDELNDFENVKVQENNSEEDLLAKTVVSLDINEENIDDPQQFINEVIDDEITDDEKSRN